MPGGWTRIALFACLVSVLHAGELPRFQVPLRVNRTASAAPAGTIDFGAAGLPLQDGRVAAGRAAGGARVEATRTTGGYSLTIGGQTVTLTDNGSAAVDVRGLPYVIRSESNSLAWIPHYRAEGTLRLGVCAANVEIFDTDGNGLFDDLARVHSVAVDIYDDGRFLFDTTFELCGRIFQAEQIASDGSSITFVQRARMAAAVGQRAPALSVLTTAGETIALDRPPLKPLLIDFWAVWCSICLSEFPTLKQLYENRSVDIVSINIDDSLSAPAALAVVSRNSPTWPQVLTGQGVATSAWQAFQHLSHAGGLPVYALIDEGGILRYAGTGGGPTLPEIKAALAALSR